MDFKMRQNKVSVRPVLRVCGKRLAERADQAQNGADLPGTLSFFA